MISQKQLEEEIVNELDTARAEERVVVASWLVNGILKSWEQPGGADSGRWELCGQKHVRTTVQKLVNCRESGVENGQCILPGYELVRADYLVKRDGEQCIVPTLALSEEEGRGKLREFRSQIYGYTAHADEFERFCDERWPGAAVAT